MRPSKAIQHRQGFNSLIITIGPVAYVWYGGHRTIFLHEVDRDEGQISPEPFEHFIFGEDQETVGVLAALEAINERLELDEVIW